MRGPVRSRCGGRLCGDVSEGVHDGGHGPVTGSRRLLPRDPLVVRGGVPGPHRRPGGRLAGDRRGARRPGRRADRLREDAGRLPRRPGPAGRHAASRRPGPPLPCAVRLTAEGPGGGRRAQSAQPADRHPSGVGAARASRARHPCRGPFRRHSGRRAPRAGPAPAGHPDHHARVAVPDAHLRRPRGPALSGDGDPGRGPRRGRDEARRSSGALPGAPGRAAGPPGPPHRAVGDGASGGRGGALPLAPARRARGAAALGQGVRPVGRGARAGHGRAGRLTGAGRGRGGARRPGGPALHLAVGGGADRRPRPGPPLHHRLRQLPAPGRAAVQPAQRDRLRAGHRRARSRGALARRADGRVRGGGGRSTGTGPRPPRLGLQGAALPGRGGPEGGPPAGGGGHLQPGAGHRHGRGGPGGPGGVPALGRLRAAAGGPCRAPGGRGLGRGGLPQVPGRSGAVRGGHRADARGRHRGPAHPLQPAGRTGAADRRHGRRGHLGRRRAARGRTARRALRLAAGVGVHRRAGHARRALPVRRLRRAAPAPGVGPRRPHRRRPSRGAAAGGHLGRDDPRPRTVRCLPRRCRPEEGGRSRRRAGRGDGLRVAGGRCVHPGHDQLAHRGHHPRPRPGHPGPRRPRAAAVLEGRPARPPAGTGPRAGSVPARDRRAGTGGRPGAAGGGRTGRVGRGQRPGLSGRAAAGLRSRPRRPYDRGGALPRRAGRLADRDPLPLRRPGARALGAGAGSAAGRAVRHGRAGDARRRRHRAATARHRSDGLRPRRGLRHGLRRGFGPGPGPRERPGPRPRPAPRRRRRRPVRPGRGGADRHRPGRRLGPVRLPLPRVRRPRPAAAPPRPRPAHSSVAAAPAGRPTTAGRQ